MAMKSTPGPWARGDAIDGIYVTPRTDTPREFQSEIKPAVIVGFSAPDWVVARNWGWLGDALVRFDDGKQVWQSLQPREIGSRA